MSTPEPAPAREPAATESSALIPEDVAFGLEELPAGFWDTPAEPADTAALGTTEAAKVTPPSLVASGTGTPLSSDTEPALEERSVQGEEEPADEAAPASELERAFAQLQSLFPGRVVEVWAPAAGEAAAGSTPEPLDDEVEAEGGYDDDDQDRLSFGPGGA